MASKPIELIDRTQQANIVEDVQSLVRAGEDLLQHHCTAILILAEQQWKLVSEDSAAEHARQLFGWPRIERSDEELALLRCRPYPDDVTVLAELEMHCSRMVL